MLPENDHHHPRASSPMDNRLNKKIIAGSTIVIFLLLFLFVLTPMTVWSADDEAEILIFSVSPEKVKEQQGVLKIQISTFSPIKQVTVRGKPQKFPKDASLVWLTVPYTLEPGVNTFEVYVKTDLGEAKNIIRTVYETPAFLNKSKLGDPFQLITILGSTTTDNLDKAEENTTKSKAFTSNILFVPSYRFDIFEDSSIFLRGVLMGDQHHNGEFESKEILFKQASIEWEERESWVGVLTLSLGTNEAGTREIPITETPRDSLSKKYKRATRDNIYTLKAKQELEKGTTWNWQIDRKKKHVMGTNNDDSGFSTTLAAGYVTPIFGVKTTFGGTLEDTNLNGADKDTKAYKTKLKVDYPIPPVLFGLQHDFSQTEDKTDLSQDGKIKNRNQVYTLSLNYPATAWCILGLTQKHERQSSNLVGKTYKVNSTQLQVILIY